MSRDDFVARFIADLCASSTNSVKSELTTIKTIFLHLLLFAKLTWWDKARSFFFVVTEIENCLHYRIYFVLLYCLFSTHMYYVSCHHLKLQHEYSTRCQIIIIFFHETLEYRWRKSSERNMWVKHIDDSFLFTTDDICTVDYESSMEYLIYIYFLFTQQSASSVFTFLSMWQYFRWWDDDDNEDFFGYYYTAEEQATLL